MQASIARRAFAFWMDVAMIFGLYLLIGALVNMFGVEPEEYYPPAEAMQLFTEREMLVFWQSTGITFFLFVLYSLILPLTRVQGTLGQLFADIKLTDEKGDRPTYTHIVLRVMVQLGKLVSIMIPGPVIAVFGGPASLSFLALLGIVSFHVIAPLTQAKNKDKATWVERLTKTRFYMRR